MIEEIGSVPISSCIEAVWDNAWMFGAVTFRQDFPATPHGDTETIYLRMPPVITGWGLYESMDCIDWPPYEIQAFQQAADAVGEIAGERLARAMIINLPPGGIIAPHIDEGPYADATTRYHLPLAKNVGCWLKVADQTRHLELGTVYRFNKHVLHSGANDGVTDRIHLVVDTFND